MNIWTIVSEKEPGKHILSHGTGPLDQETVKD